MYLCGTYVPVMFQIIIDGSFWVLWWGKRRKEGRQEVCLFLSVLWARILWRPLAKSFLRKYFGADWSTWILRTRNFPLTFLSKSIQDLPFYRVELPDSELLSSYIPWRFHQCYLCLIPSEQAIPSNFNFVLVLVTWSSGALNGWIIPKMMD